MDEHQTEGQEDKKDFDPDLVAAVQEALVEDTTPEDDLETDDGVISKKSFTKRIGKLTASNRMLKRQLTSVQEELDELKSNQAEEDGRHSDVITGLKGKNKNLREQLEDAELRIQRLTIGLEEGLPLAVAQLITTGETREEILDKAEELKEIVGTQKQTVLVDGSRGSNGKASVVTSEEKLLSLKAQRMKY